MASFGFSFGHPTAGCKDLNRDLTRCATDFPRVQVLFHLGLYSFLVCVASKRKPTRDSISPDRKFRTQVGCFGVDSVLVPLVSRFNCQDGRTALEFAKASSWDYEVVVLIVVRLQKGAFGLCVCLFLFVCSGLVCFVLFVLFCFVCLFAFL